MKYYKKLNSIGEIEWLAKAGSISALDAIEITEDEYLSLIKKDEDLDNPLIG